MHHPDPDQAIATLDPRVIEICQRIASENGRAYLIGGFVRDWLRGEFSKDIDIEVFGLDLDTLRRILAEFEGVDDVGKSFGVLRVSGLDVDFAVPRRDSFAGRGHRGIHADLDPLLSVEEAALRRDLTINTLSLDPLSGEVLDPWGGMADLEAGLLRAVDRRSFGEDPLRALRVMQFAARFEMSVDDETLSICAEQDLGELSPERIYGEFTKWAQLGRRPSLGLDFLRETDLLRFFPELAALIGVPQDPRWHPEGDVWTHTRMVVDEAARLRRQDPRWDLALMFGALCHDLGKATTTQDDGERIRSRAHDTAGVPLVATFLGRMRAPLWLVESVQALTRAHLAPIHFENGKAGDRAYRRLARRLARAGVSLELLEALARADHFGRSTEEAQARSFPAGDHFLDRAQALEIRDRAPTDVVHGRHLLARGLQPGPHIGEILARCRAVQDETGWTDPDKILARALDP